MTVYVDEPIHAFGRMLMCHMVSPDIAKSKRTLAIAAGAVAIDREQMIIVSKAAFNAHCRPQMHGYDDLFSVFRGKDGRPDHRQLPRLLAWWEDQQQGQGDLFA